MNKIDEANLKIKQLEYELEKLKHQLKRWETLTVEDGFYTFNCLKETGSKNWLEYLNWKDKNPDKTVDRKGIECIIVPKIK